MVMGIKTKVANVFIEGITNRPEDFTEGPFRLVDKKTGRNWWIATAPLSLHLYEPYEQRVGLYHSIRCWLHLRKWRKLKRSYGNERKEYLSNLKDH